MREYALQHEARFQAVEEEGVEDWISGHKEDEHFLHPAPGTPDDPTHSLFAFPAEENFSGKKYPLRWIREIQVLFSRKLKRSLSGAFSLACSRGATKHVITSLLVLPTGAVPLFAACVVQHIMLTCCGTELEPLDVCVDAIVPLDAHTKCH
jgi:hypothetical protein